MIQIVYLVTDPIVNSIEWALSQKVIDTIRTDIQFYKNLSFKVLNLDKEAVTRTDPSASGVNNFPHLRAFDDSGKIIDNWGIKRIEIQHWENWRNKYGVKYTLQELDDLRKSPELIKLEEERKRLEQLELEAKKRSEAEAKEKKYSENTLLFVGLGLGLLLLIKK